MQVVKGRQATILDQQVQDMLVARAIQAAILGQQVQVILDQPVL
jgi:hypothetical protein